MQGFHFQFCSYSIVQLSLQIAALDAYSSHSDIRSAQIAFLYHSIFYAFSPFSNFILQKRDKCVMKLSIQNKTNDTIYFIFVLSRLMFFVYVASFCYCWVVEGTQWIQNTSKYFLISCK